MKKALMVFLCMAGMAAYAKDYYVSSSGSDSADGLTSSTPWQSIQKVNSVFSGLVPGDRILFKRGDRFYGSLQISRSGISGSPVTISSYGSGSTPVITAFTTINGWNNYGGGIYSKAVTCQSRPNMVTVNDINTPIGRWPNSGFLSIDSHVANTSITDSELPSSPDWTGGEVVIRVTPYIYDRNIIKGHTGSTINYTSSSGYSARDGYGYFIQNSIKTLDQLGEWFYDGSTFYMYFGSANPNSYVVKVSTIDQLVNLLDRNYITFDNITFEGANVYGLQISNSANITVQNCSINYTGGIAIFGPWNGSSTNCKITNNSIGNTNNNGIKLMGNHTNAFVTNNTISKTGLIIGMGGSGDGSYVGCDVNGPGSIIQYNSIENTGYIGISFSGNNILIANNLVYNFNLIKNDGGGIYTYVGSGGSFTGQKITGNIILNGIGFGDGLSLKEGHACGIYMDDRVRNVAISNNTIARCTSSGLYMHNAHEIEINGNTFYDNGSGRTDLGCQILFVHDTYSPDDPIRNIKMNNNILFARADPEVVIAFSTTDNDMASFGTADNNCYARPINNTYIARTWAGGWNSMPVMRSLSSWQSFTGQDLNSTISPITVSDVNKIRFEYNSSNSNKIISLDGSYIDVKGAKYSGTITLQPYSSAVLMVDPNPSAAPVIPAYVGSAVENGTPSVVEMTFSYSLANIIPSASAFSVQVNSVSRAVNSVSISGTKVLLTLASPVAYGNTLTVAYTKPAANPLQTSAGGQAASFTGQPVTNRVSAPLPPAVPVFVSAAVENETPSRIDLSYNLNLANIIPSVSAFSVQVNSVTRAINSVSVSGTKVLLTLASPVAYGNSLTVTYTKPAANPLQTSAGGQAASFSGQPVTNRVSAPPPPAVPVFVSASVMNETPSRIELVYNLTLANIIPSVSAFSVQVNSVARAINSVSVSGTKVLLTLAAPVAYGNTLTVAYTKPAANPLQTSAGGQAASFSGQPVTNRVSAPPPPAVPVFVSASVANENPSRIELTYNLTLANIIPPASSFSVSVNSVARQVSSVVVSGVKVYLTLSAPVTYGNSVTVSYTKPLSNPLQTAAGGQAASFAAQNVTNAVNAVIPPNKPPVAIVNYQSSTYSGFEGVLNASGSYDTDNDRLTYTWLVPGNIPVSSTNQAMIRYLSPIVSVPQKVEFTLKVSDGKTTQSKIIPVEILPYQPGLKTAEVVRVEASSYQAPYYPHNILDGEIGTMWSARGDQQWVLLELKEPFNINHIKLAFQPGQNKEAYFDILGSEDEVKWESVLLKSKSCGFSGNLHVFDFPPSKTNKEFRFVKLVGLGNAVDDWNYIAEFRIFGMDLRNPPDYENQIVKIFPNPARTFTNILIEDQTFTPDFIKIVNLTGKIIFQDKLDPGIRELKIPITFGEGIYIVEIGKGLLTGFTQKLIVTN